MAELVGVMVGQYFLLECLRREGIAETYRARPTTRGGYDVTLRLFRPQFPDPSEFRERFAAEAEKVWRCHHEHIQPLLEYGAGDGLLYSVTMLTEDETLERYLERQQEQFLPLDRVVQLVTQLCAALQHAHEQGIVHSNVQPSSIVMQDEGHVLLTDFGMRRAYRESDVLVAQIEEGNPAYTAPEQTLGMPGPASDIYALGVLLFRLLGGCLPYDGESAGEIALKHSEEPIPSLRALRPEVPEALELVIRVALAKSSDARFPSVAALAQALAAAMKPGASLLATVVPQRRIVVNRHHTALTWARASSLLALLILLFGLASTLFFVFTPLQHVNIPDWLLPNGGTSVSPGATSTPTLAGTSPAGTGTPGTSGRGPVISRRPGGPTPTAGLARTPTPGVTPGPKPTRSPGMCFSGDLSIDGSPNLLALLQQVSDDYLALCPGLAVTVGGNGNLAALNALEQGQLEIAATEVTPHRVPQGLTDHLAGALLYAVIINPDIQVGGLSSAALQGIYHGQITNWAQVGGPDEAIRVILRPRCDAISTIFRAFVLGGRAEHVRGIRLRDDQSSLIVQAVAEVPGSISYVPLMYAQDAAVHILSIDGAAPGMQSVLQDSYPFWSVEHLYTQGSGTQQAQTYISFLTGSQEASTVARFSVVPVSVLPSNIASSHLPGPLGDGYCFLT